MRDESLDLTILRTTGDDLEYLLSRMHLINTLSGCIEQFPDAAAFFLYLEERDDYIAVARSDLEYGTRQDMKAQVAESQNALREWSGWQTLRLDGRLHMAKAINLSGIWLGVCMNSDALTAPLRSIALPDTVQLSARYRDGSEDSIALNGGTPAASDRVVSVRSGVADYTLSLRIRPAGLFSDLTFLHVLLMGLTLGILLLAVILISYFSKILTRPVSKLTEAMGKLQAGNLDSQVRIEGGFREIRALQTTFNEMSNEIKNLKIDVYEEKLSLQQTQLDYAQVQAKPHFYLNCLNIIYNLSAKGDLERIRLVTGKLMEYFRFILKSDQSSVSLAEETANIRSFVELQKVRYPAHFRYEEVLDCDPDAVKIPPMLLLPLVENCFKYAINMVDETVIRLYAGPGRAAGSMLFRVSNFGTGFPAEVLRTFAGGEPIRQQGRICIGLSNIRQRLALVYGKRAVMTLYNPPGGGASVEISIAAQSAASIEPEKAGEGGAVVQCSDCGR